MIGMRRQISSICGHNVRENATGIDDKLPWQGYAPSAARPEVSCDTP